MLRDVANIWTSAIQPIQDDGLRQRLNFHAVDAFVAVAQCHICISGNLPKFTRQNSLRLLNTTLESDYTRPMATYAIGIILNLGKSTQVAAVTNETQAERFIETLFTTSDDLERGAVEEDVIDLRIYSTLVLLKRQPAVGLNIEKVNGLIGQMKGMIGNAPTGGSGVARGSEADIDLDRVRWKAIYLSTLLFKFVSDGERGKCVEELRTRVQMLVESGELSVVDDYEHCLEPLDTGLELRTPSTEQQEQISAAFEVWIGRFPLFPLFGSVASTEA